MITTGKVVALIQAMGGGADPAVIEAKVEEWLDAHPEATTTVQDGSITEQKLATSIAQKLGLISSLSDEIDSIDDRVTVLENGGTDGASPIINSASGAVASFADGSASPARSVVVTLEPVQAGNGDPSPDNIRTITGWDGVNVNMAGVNIFDRQIEDGGINDSTGEKIDLATQHRSKNFIRVLPSTSYFIKSINEGTIWIYYYTEDKTYIGRASSGSSVINQIIQTPSNCHYLMLKTYPYSFDATGISINYPATETGYDSNAVKSVDIAFPSEAGTVYGGTYDFVTGKLIVDRAEIASYNGETLPGEWISDRDVYAVGTTPSTGAQVVYMLATPVEYDLTPQQLATLLGQNNVWSTNGTNTAIEYKADTKLYIDGKIAELSALIASL